MRRHTLMRAVMVTAIIIGTTGAIASTAAIADTVIAAVDPAQQAAADRARVKRIAKRDPRPEVQTSAWTALLSSRGDEAIAEFLATGLDKARARAIDNARRNTDIIQRTITTSLPGSNVRVTAERALRGTDAERDEYVRTGFAKAQEADRLNDNKYQEHVAKQAQADRDYVTRLSVDDPGPQVRAAASRALRTGDDADIADFFTYYWPSAAKLDDEAFRMFTADRDVIWHNTVRRLQEAALAAERAERESSGALADKARADAIAAWRSISDQADVSSVNWGAERDKALAQAASWATVADYARTATTDQDWASVLARAGANQKSWADEAEWAIAQAAKWTGIADQARASADAATIRNGGNQ
ncbi:hypothetical protein [Amycolatopsis sp. NPDC059657]|uniref:hypothetical protein n=1 Tax=Amycolatopsis sp. NPDC059657 TaxID=3346899 RepID=UPI00366BF975